MLSISYTPITSTRSLLDLTGQLVKSEPHSIAWGEYTNIYKAHWVAKDSVNVNHLSCSLFSSCSSSHYYTQVAVKDFKVLNEHIDLDKRIV
jgi:hypothetical protein